ncbi:allose kinase [Lachnospiraceae bacterium 54-53]
MGQVIGIDIGGTNFRLGCVAEDGELSHFEMKSSAPLLKAGAWEVLSREILNYMNRYSLEGEVEAVAVGIPSAVSKDKSFVYSTPNLKGLENMDLGHLLERSLGIRVFVDRDVNYLLCHDIKKYGLDPDRDKTILGMYLGTGLGNAIYICGNFHAGRNGVAGELGHIPFYHIKEACPCGNEGCVELRCSGAHLQRICNKHYPNTDIGEIFTRHRDENPVREFLDYLAYPISTEITILDPDYVVMGGGVMTMRDFPMDYLIRQVKKRARHPYPSENLRFVFPEHTQASGVSGGGLAAYEGLKKCKKI